MAEVRNFNWGQPSQPPTLSSQQWNFVGVIGAILAAMALLQIISFQDFRDILNNVGLGAPSIWAAALILAELWGAAGFFKIRLSQLFRKISNLMAFLAAGFWFYVSVSAASGSTQSMVDNNGFFGRFLGQMPGWWTVMEASILLFAVLYIMELTKANLKFGR